ncbi:IGS10 protein, partial [Chionis minor]|nr:IGS10 protein [Chionis minor]
EDGRIVVAETGTFMLRAADTFDAGLYHCIGTNYNDADTLTFRITVVDPYVEDSGVNGAKLSPFVGSTLYLPCTASAAPDAAVSWVLPEHVILHQSAGNRQLFDNGTLRVQGVTERDSGYFQCVAANQYGVDLLVFQVLVRKDETALKKKQVAAGVWEEEDGSGHAVLASAARQERPLATPATLTAPQEPAASASRNRVTQSAHKRNGYGKMTYRHYRDKISRRFRGHRRQFVSSARRVDPQRWAAFLEKTKRNLTVIEKRGEVATKPPIQSRTFSKVAGDEEETSGDPVSPEEEFMIPVTEAAAVSPLGRATGSAATAGPETRASSIPAGKTSLPVAEAPTPLPSPFSPSVSSDSRRPQTDLNPTITSSWERSDLSQISANGAKQSAVANGASRTSTLFPAGQRLVYSGESNNQHLKSVSTTPTTDVTDTSKSVTSQNAVDKLRVFTEPTGRTSTKTDHQVSVVTVSEPSPEFGHIYFQSTQKQVTPKPALYSPTITPQQIQIIQGVTTRTPQAQQQYGRRRKISGRRRIVRPGRIPSMREHRFNFGRPGSVRGSTAVAADVQLNMKYVSNLPTLNNLSSSIDPFSPEAPLSSPSTTNTPLEHPAGAHQNTAFLREEENKARARQKATTTGVPLITKGTQDTPQRTLGTSAPFQTNTDRVQTFSIRRPTPATPTAHMATEIARTISTKIPSALEPVSPSIKPRTSANNSQRGKVTWEGLFGNGAQEEVLLQKLPNHQIDMFLSTEVSTTLPKTTAALSVSKMPLLPLRPVSAGGNHSGGFLSLSKPTRYGSGKPEEPLSTAKPQSDSNPAARATKQTDVTSLKPAVTPIVTPQAGTKITKKKIFRVGRKRGQRRRRPPKTPTPQSVTVGQSSAAIPSVSAATPVVTAVTAVTTPASLSPAKPLVELFSGAEAPAPGHLTTPEAPQHVPTAARRPAAATVPGGGTPQTAPPPDGLAAQSPAAPQTAPPPVSPTSARPATLGAATGSEPAQQIAATAAAGENARLESGERGIQEHREAQPALPARAGSRARAPAAPADIPPPGAPHPTPPP